MKPELINRFDEVVIFNELSKLNSEKILQILLADVHASLATKGIKFIVFSSRRRHTILVSDWSSDVCSSDLAHVCFSSRRRHTRLVSDWSSDVCSSDLEHTSFFQAEDGIRDWSVTGVQTCALPI